MSPVLHRRCIVALLVALWSACAVALMAWGAVEIPSNAVILNLQGPINGYTGLNSLVTEPLVWAGLGIIALAAWGLWLFSHRQRRVTDMSWPWRLLLITSAGQAAWWVLQTFMVIEYHGWYKHVSQAILGILLFLGVMSERVDVRWGRASMVYACCGLMLTYGFGWALSEKQIGEMDLRILLLLQILPLLLVPAGALSHRYDDDSMGCSECTFMCVVYVVTITATWIPDLWLSEFPTGNTSLEALWYAMPWIELIALCLLMLIPVGRALQKTANCQAIDRRKTPQLAVSGFALNSLPIPSKRSSS